MNAHTDIPAQMQSAAVVYNELVLPQAMRCAMLPAGEYAAAMDSRDDHAKRIAEDHCIRLAHHAAQAARSDTADVLVALLAALRAKALLLKGSDQDEALDAAESAASALRHSVDDLIHGWGLDA